MHLINFYGKVTLSKNYQTPSLKSANLEYNSELQRKRDFLQDSQDTRQPRDVRSTMKIQQMIQKNFKNLRGGNFQKAGHTKRYWYLITTSSFPVLGVEVDETTVHMSEKRAEETLSFQRQTTSSQQAGGKKNHETQP